MVISKACNIYCDDKFSLKPLTMASSLVSSNLYLYITHYPHHVTPLKQDLGSFRVDSVHPGALTASQMDTDNTMKSKLELDRRHTVQKIT